VQAKFPAATARLEYERIDAANGDPSLRSRQTDLRDRHLEKVKAHEAH
jgi:hypothetical protein